MTADHTNIDARLEELERTSRTLEVDAAQRGAWRKAVVDFSESFLEDLEHLPAFGKPEGPGDPAAEIAIAESPTPLPKLLDAFQRQVLDVHLNPASPRFFGYIPGGGVYPASLGDFLAALTNRYSGVFFASPGTRRDARVSHESLGSGSWSRVLPATIRHGTAKHAHSG